MYHEQTDYIMYKAWETDSVHACLSIVHVSVIQTQLFHANKAACQHFFLPRIQSPSCVQVYCNIVTSNTAFIMWHEEYKGKTENRGHAGVPVDSIFIASIAIYLQCF